MESADIKRAADLIQEGIRILAKGPMEFYLHRMAECHAKLLTYAPFKIGDRACLAKAPKLHADSGWWGSRHYLIEGSPCQIRAVDFYDGYFHFDVTFDKETWIDRDGKENKPDQKHTYGFAEHYLRRIP